MITPGVRSHLGTTHATTKLIINKSVFYLPLLTTFTVRQWVFDQAVTQREYDNHYKDKKGVNTREEEKDTVKGKEINLNNEGMFKLGYIRKHFQKFKCIRP